MNKLAPLEASMVKVSATVPDINARLFLEVLFVGPV